MLLIGYYRVSTTRQGQSGLGLEAQREAVHQYAKEVGATLAAEHVEIESGTRNARPVLAEAMAECRRRKGTLCIAKLDRLARNVAFVSTLLDSKVEFVACDAPHATRMMLQILSVFAEHEARMISDRTRAALAAAKARGVRLGSHGQVLAEKHKAGAKAFALSMKYVIIEAKNGGAQTLTAIADKLNADGHLTREGGKWHPMTVSRTVKLISANDPQHLQSIAA